MYSFLLTLVLGVGRCDVSIFVCWCLICDKSKVNSINCKYFGYHCFRVFWCYLPAVWKKLLIFFSTEIVCRKLFMTIFFEIAWYKQYTNDGGVKLWRLEAHHLTSIYILHFLNHIEIWLFLWCFLILLCGRLYAFKFSHHFYCHHFIFWE